MITFFVASFFPRPRKEKNLKKNFHLLLNSLDKAFPGLPVIALAGFTHRQHRFAFCSLRRATENSVTRTAESEKMLSRDQNFFNHRLKSMVRELGWKKTLVHGGLRSIVTNYIFL